MGRKQRYIAPVPKYNYTQFFTCCIACVLVSVLTAAVAYHFLEKPVESTRKLLISAPYCKIPEIVPTSHRDLKIKRSKLPDCKNPGFLSSITSTLSEKDPISLNYLPDYLQNYGATEASCCYQELMRKPGNDSEIVASEKCEPFAGKHELDAKVQYVYVRCFEGEKLIYKMVHAIIAKKKIYVKRRQQTSIDGKRAFKVLMIGFDNMSAVNFKRSMAAVRDMIVNKTEWFEMKGYMRVGRNSFANLFPILTGQSSTQKYKKCHPQAGGFLDSCGFIWADYQKAGYITAYAEDQAQLSTFNLHHKGFNRKPTDYYFRPYVLATEKYIKPTNIGNLAFCVDKVPYMDNIFVFAQKLTYIHESTPYFGYIYTNSISSRQLLTSVRMGKRIAGGVVIPLENDTEDAIVIYFGDSGTRLEPGPDGYYEERHPFLFIKLPPRFRKRYPDLTQNLRDNAGKVTSPYDLHITLRHILNLSVGKRLHLGSVGCIGCRSMLQYIPAGRRCSEAGIPDENCSCSLQDIDSSKEMVQKVAEFGVDELNRKLATRKTKKGEKCSVLTLSNVTSSRTQLASQSKLFFIVTFTVANSKAHFEVIVRKKLTSLLSTEPKFELVHEVINMSDDSVPEICKARAIEKPIDANTVDKRFPETSDEDYSDADFLDDFDPKLYGLDRVKN